jgi:outer membrane protein TolC
LAVALGAAAFAASAATLTLDEAQRLAVERSRQLPAQAASIEASRRMALAAGQLPDPVLKAGLDNVPAEGPDRYALTRDFMTMRRIGIAQEFTGGEKRALRRERYEREAEKGEAEKQVALAAVQRETAIAWLDRYFMESLASVLAEQLRAAATEVQAADAAYRGGRGAQAEVFAARTAFATLQDREADVGGRVRAARVELARWTGSPPDTPLGSPPPLDTLALPQSGVEQHLAGHPEIIAIERQADMAATEARLAQAARKPDWTWEASYQVRGSAYGNMFSIGVSMPLPWDAANRQEREASAKLAQVEEATARRDEMLRAHVSEVERMRIEWGALRDRVGRYRAEIIPLAIERTQAATAAYAGGRGSLAEVLGARRGEFDARLAAVQLELDAARLWARLTFLLPKGGWQ